MELAKVAEVYNLLLDDMHITAQIHYEEKQYVIEFYLEGKLFHKATKRRYNLLDKPTDLLNVAIKNFMKLHKATIESNAQLQTMVDHYKEVIIENKVVTFETGEGALVYNIIMTEYQGRYDFVVTNNINSDNVHFSMESDSFSDIMEKLTIYVRSINHAIDIVKDNLGVIEKGKYAQKYTIKED